MNTIDWDQVLINASISALQGIQESGKIGEVTELIPHLLAQRAVKVGQALVEELKKAIYQVS